MRMTIALVALLGVAGIVAHAQKEGGSRGITYDGKQIYEIACPDERLICWVNPGNGRLEIRLLPNNDPAWKR